MDKIYSVALALYGRLSERTTFKLLLQNDLNSADLIAAVDAFHAFLTQLRVGTLSTETAKQLLSVDGLGGMIALAYIRELKVLEVLDPRPQHIRDQLRTSAD